MTPTVLVIEDDVDQQLSYTKMLNSQGMDVVPAGNGAAAQRLLKEQSFALILLDIFLDDTDGISLLRRIREMGVTCPVVAITGFYNQGDTAQGINRAPFDAYFIKPIEVSEFLSFVKGLTQPK